MTRYIACLFLLLALPSNAQVVLLPGNPGVSQNITYVNAGTSLVAARNAATAGTTIAVGPGTYGPNETNLFKNGVNWFFYPGSIISNQYSADVSCFDNSFEGVSGAVTSIISGDLTFIDNASTTVGNIFRGSFMTVSNPLSKIIVRASKISNPAGDSDPGIRHLGGGLDFDVDSFIFENGGTCLYWGEGNEDVRGRWLNMDAGTDAPLWCEGAGLGNWYLTGEVLDSVRLAGGGAGAVYFKPASAQKLWLNVKEIRGASVAAGYGGCLTVTTGKVYLSYQKLSAIEDTATARALIQIDSGEVWLTGQKMTVTNNQHYLAQIGGKAWIRNQHYEDAGVGSSTRLYNYIVSGGTNYFQGGRAETLWGPFFKLTAGQLQIEDATINTFSTLQGSNVCLWITGGAPVIKNSIFIPGSLFSVSNSGAGDLRVWGTGGLMAKSNITATLTVRGGSVTVDGTYVDR
jgi:hypothetical protein